MESSAVHLSASANMSDALQKQKKPEQHNTCIIMLYCMCNRNKRILARTRKFARLDAHRGDIGGSLLSQCKVTL